MDVRSKNIWIVGAARSGLAAAKLLSLNGAKVFVTDSGAIDPSVKSILSDLNVLFEEGGHSIERLLKEASVVVLSPSIPLDSTLPLAALQAGIPVVSEIEVASWFIPESAIVIGITGTNGKSTTTHYANQLFTLAQRNSVACGNYGRALSDALLDPAKFNTFVVEVSSYQLETTFSFHPHVSIFLNLQNDHQLRYGTMDEYLKAKWRLILLTRPDGLAVIDAQVLKRAIAIGLSLPRCRIAISYGFLDQPSAAMVMDSLQCAKMRRDSMNLFRPIHLPTSSYGSLGALPIASLTDADLLHSWLIKHESSDRFSVHIASLTGSIQDQSFDIDKPVLPGDHNQVNILSASLAAIQTGLHPNVARAQWTRKGSAYYHLPHRLEEVEKDQSFLKSSGEQVSVRIINDSKATNVESTLVAIKSFNSPMRVLLGGEPKGDFYGEMIPYIGNNIVKIYPFGKAAPLICQQLAIMSDKLAPSSKQLIEAAQLALDESADGDIILLSPACASFDEFKNFEHRGDSFRHWATLRRVNSF